MRNICSISPTETDDSSGFLQHSNVIDESVQDPKLMSYDEITNELDGINLRLWQSNNWDYVIVPFGEWIVGQDIPEGAYMLYPAESARTPNITIQPFDEPTSVDWLKPTSRYYCDSVSSLGIGVTLMNGDIVLVEGITNVRFVSSEYRPAFRAFSDETEDTSPEIYARYDELMAALKTKTEWESVYVPTGVYEIGTQIPQGRWTIWPDGERKTWVFYGKTRSADGGVYASGNIIVDRSSGIYQAERFRYNMSLNLEENWYIKTHDQGAIFTTYAGKTLFTFFKKH